jgi:hypothetical protein
MPVFPAEVGKGLAEQCAVSDFDMPWSAFAVASLAPSSPKASEAERTHVRTERHDFLQAATCSASSLLTPQCQELSIGGEDLRHRLLELPPSLNTLADRLNPFIGDTFDPFLALDHEGEGPHRMAFTAGAVTGGLATTTVCQCK